MPSFVSRIKKQFEDALSQQYAALRYESTVNLGDEIQTIAALRFLPRVDSWVDRERLSKFRGVRGHKIILNGWFLHRPEHWPLAKSLKPLITSFHITKEIVPAFNRTGMSATDAILGPVGLDYLRQHQPIGARDLHTLSLLQNAGVEAYFSGCLTLTLDMNDAGPRDDAVIAVDVSDDVFSFLSRRCDGPVFRIEHDDTETAGPARFEKARALLRRYATARLVVTTRLHCALPCLALGTPVLHIEEAADHYRFDGLRDFLHQTSEDELCSGSADFDINDPPPNDTAWHGLRDQLISTCEEFVQGR